MIQNPKYEKETPENKKGDAVAINSEVLSGFFRDLRNGAAFGKYLLKIMSIIIEIKNTKRKSLLCESNLSKNL